MHIPRAMRLEHPIPEKFLDIIIFHVQKCVPTVPHVVLHQTPPGPKHEIWPFTQLDHWRQGNNGSRERLMPCEVRARATVKLHQTKEVIEVGLPHLLLRRAALGQAVRDRRVLRERDGRPALIEL